MISAEEALERVRNLRLKLSRIEDEKNICLLRNMKANAVPVNHMEFYSWIYELEMIEKYLSIQG